MPCNAVVEIGGKSETFEIAGVISDKNRILCIDSMGDSIWLSLDSIWAQLILTPLSEITDEHAIEVAKIAVSENGYIKPCDYSICEINESGIFLNINESDRFVIGFDKCLFTFADIYLNPEPCGAQTAIIDYLRSKSYDLGHGQIPSLIEAGIAIKG